MDLVTAFVTIAIALITAVIGPSVIEWVRSFLARKQQLSLPEAIHHNEIVDHQLDIMIDELGCDRISISQFHNGGHFYPTGKSIQKFSIFYEKTTPEIISIQHTFQNIPTSLFPKSLAKLYRDGDLAIVDYDTDEYYDLMHYHTEYGTQSFYMITLNDLEGQFIGVLSIAYNHKKHRLTKEEWYFLREKAGALGNILSGYLKKSNK